MSKNASQEPAFPIPASCREAGMTLRDYFAAKALHGMVGRPWSGFAKFNTHALNAYLYADAMLAARERSAK